MDMYESIIKCLAIMARKNLNEAMILEACLGFTVGELNNATTHTRFKEIYGERLHFLISDIINHME